MPSFPQVGLIDNNDDALKGLDPPITYIPYRIKEQGTIYYVTTTDLEKCQTTTDVTERDDLLELLKGGQTVWTAIKDPQSGKFKGGAPVTYQGEFPKTHPNGKESDNLAKLDPPDVERQKKILKNLKAGTIDGLLADD